jgi:hypothetical protein
MREGPVNMIIGVIASGVVANPMPSIDVGRVGMTVLVAEVAFGVGFMRRSLVLRRPMRRDRLMSAAVGGTRVTIVTLGKGGKGENKQSCQN